MSRQFLVQCHPSRPEAQHAAQVVARELDKYGIEAVSTHGADDVELAIVLGGDGTILRTAEMVRGHNTQIGRASCRERGEKTEGDGAVKGKAKQGRSGAKSG